MEGTCRKWEELKGGREGKKRSVGKGLEVQGRKDSIYPSPITKSTVYSLKLYELFMLLQRDMTNGPRRERGSEGGKKEREEGTDKEGKCWNK